MSQENDPIQIFTEGFTTSAMVAVTPPQGPIDVPDHPLLVQMGDGIRTVDNGTLVTAIAARAREIPDVGALAFEFRTTTEHVRQALDFVHRVDTAETHLG